MLLAATANETVATTHPAYAYSFTYLAKQSGYQALHASDLPFFFGDSGEFDTADLFTAEERTLRSAMQRNLLHFVATGRPAASDWMPFSSHTASVMEFGETPTVVKAWKAARCDMWRRQRQATRWLGDAELKRVLCQVAPLKK